MWQMHRADAHQMLDPEGGKDARRGNVSGMSFSRSFLSLKKYSQEVIYLTNIAEITEEVLTKSIYATHIVEVTEEVLTKSIYATLVIEALNDHLYSYLYSFCFYSSKSGVIKCA